MSDELDVLRHDHDVVEPDPLFRAELMDRLRHVMASGSDLAPDALTLSRVVSGTTEKDTPHRRRPPQWLAVVAIAACLLTVVAVAAVVMFDNQAVDTIDPAAAPTTSPASATTEQYGRVPSVSTPPRSKRGSTRKSPATTWKIPSHNTFESATTS